jgi:hypothetical protein
MFIQIETKGHIHITSRIVTARRKRMNLSVSWGVNGLTVWQDFLHPPLLNVPSLFLL